MTEPGWQAGGAIRADGPALVTIPNVPIVTTGTYQLGSNWPDPFETTFTTDDLASAVAAVDDPAVNPPRLKLGHLSEWGDAEPSFGVVSNLRLGDNGQTLYGDFVGVPAWLEDVLPSVYPGRSIEAGMNVTTPTGKRHDMVLTAVSLLGVVLPGVSTLEDLAGLFKDTVPEGVEIQAEALVEASVGGDMRMPFKRNKVTASVPLEDVRRAFYEDIAVGDQVWWWIREVLLDPNELIVDDDDGGLYRMSFEISGEDVSFGEPDEVKVQYVAASNGHAPLAGSSAAVFASRSESRPEIQATEDNMDRVRERLGLPKDATEDDILKALGEEGSDTPPSTKGPGESEGNPAEQGPETGTPTPAEDDQGSPDVDVDVAVDNKGTKQPVAASDGTVQVDGETLAEMQRNAALGAQVHAERSREIRDTTIDAAVKAGKFPPARKDHWVQQWDNDPEGAKATIAEMPDGLIPVEARGASPAVEAESQSAYDQSWLSDGERARAEGKTVASVPGTVQQEA